MTLPNLLFSIYKKRATSEDAVDAFHIFGCMYIESARHHIK